MVKIVMETNQMVATTVLEKMGCRVTPANNGLEALKIMKQRRFNLVFMDCNMPEMDGYEATRTIRKLEKKDAYHKTPIVALTAYAMVGDDQKCYDAGMDDYIIKPVKKYELARILKKWVGGKEIETSGNLSSAEHTPNASRVYFTPPGLPLTKSRSIISINAKWLGLAFSKSPARPCLTMSENS